MSESLDVKYCSTVRAAELVNDKPQPAEPDEAADKPVKYYTAERWEQKEAADPHVQMLGRVIPRIGDTALWDRGQVLGLMARAAATAAAEGARAERERVVAHLKLLDGYRTEEVVAEIAALPLPAGTAERPDVAELVELLRPPTTPDQRADLLMLSQTPRATITCAERQALAGLLADIAELEARAAAMQKTIDLLDGVIGEDAAKLAAAEARTTVAEERAKELEHELRVRTE